MPGIPKTQRTAHGMLPAPLQALAQALFPPEDIMPAPMMSAAAKGLKLVKGAATPVAEMLGAEWSRPSADRGARLLEAFRPKDLSQVMPSMPSQVPAAPRAAEQVGEAFRAFRGSGGLPEHVPQAPAHTGERASSIIEDYKGVIAALLRGKL